MNELEFYRCRIQYDERVLMPRQESEVMVFYVLERMKNCPGGVFLDLCTGSGCLGLAIKKARPDMQVILLDISLDALTVAKHNAHLNHLDVEILQGYLLEPLGGRKVDYVICNPPYVSDEEYEHLDRSVRDYEPKLALVGGKEGLDFYSTLSKTLKSHIKDGGKIFFEIGKDQGGKVLELFSDPCWCNQEVIKDWAGHDRFVFLESKLG